LLIIVDISDINKRKNIICLYQYEEWKSEQEIILFVELIQSNNIKKQQSSSDVLFFFFNRNYLEGVRVSLNTNNYHDPDFVSISIDFMSWNSYLHKNLNKYEKYIWKKFILRI
jgi:hypothetical protein